ncbi:MAG: dockerin type I domain-containing protein [Eubacterium sp.]|jgi:hypothetical protein|nr:dockerin type I domain-containing protein [Eubacterium sp.]
MLNQLKQLIPVMLSATISLVSANAVTFDIGASMVYHVSITGSDAANGSAETPWRTLQMSLDKLNPGDTLLIHEGIYNEKIIINNSGAIDNKITVKNMPGERAVIDGTGIEDKKTMIELVDINYLRIEGLEICNSNAKNYGSDVNCGIFVQASEYGGSKGVEIVNNKIYNIDGSTWGYADKNGTTKPCHMNGHGIAVYGYGINQENTVSDILIDGNEVFNNRLGQSETVVVNGNVDGFAISNNYIHDNDNIAIDVIGYEETSNGSGDIDRARNGKIFGNAIFDCDSIANMTYNDNGGSDGIYVDGGKSIEIYNNFVSGIPYGIELASENVANGVEDIYVHNNIITHCTDACVMAGGSKGGKNIRIENNTFYAAYELIAIDNKNTLNVSINDNIFLSLDDDDSVWVSRDPGSIYTASGNVYYGSEEETTKIEPGSSITEILPVASLVTGNFSPVSGFEDKGASFNIAPKYQRHYEERLKAIKRSDDLYKEMNSKSVKNDLTMDKIGYNIVTDYLTKHSAITKANAIVEMKTANNNDDGSNRTETGTSRYKGYITIGRGDDGKVNFDTINNAITAGGSEINSSITFILKTPYTIDGKTSYIVRQVKSGSIKFEPTHVGIKPIAGAHGAIFPSEPFSSLKGKDHTFIFTPDVNYTVAEVKVNGNPITLNNNSYTVSNITAETTVEAAFELIDKQKEYSVSVINGSSGGQFSSGAKVTISSNTPKNGERFKEWVITPNVSFISGDNTTETVSFIMPKESVIAKAVYEIISENSSGNSSGSDSGNSSGSSFNIISEKLDAIPNDASQEEIISALKDMGNDLEDALRYNENIIGKLAKLEEKLDIDISVSVSDDYLNIIKENSIKIVGAAFNSAPDRKNMTLSFSKPSDFEDLSLANYNKSKAIQVDIGLDGASSSGKLMIPVTITLDVSKNIFYDDFLIFQYYIDGNIKTVIPMINDDGTCSFTITNFGRFTFVNGNIRRGDCNGDCMINAEDLTCLKLYLVGKEGAEKSDYMDCNRDGKIDVADITYMKRFLVKKNGFNLSA